MPIEPSSWLRRNRETISAWVDRLEAAGFAGNGPEMEAVSWCRALPEDIRTRLESDLARLRSEDDDLEGLIDGPLGDLLARFSGLIGLDFPAREPDAPDFSAEFRELKEADPLWFANLEGFLDSLDETGDRDEE